MDVNEIGNLKYCELKRVVIVQSEKKETLHVKKFYLNVDSLEVRF